MTKDEFCIKNCDAGKAEVRRLLTECDSVFDAATTFRDFQKNCCKNCNKNKTVGE